MVYSAVSDDSGTISTFLRYDLIKLNHNGVLSGYQKLIEITFDNHMQTAFQDIRFTTLMGVHVPYWIESKVDSTSAKVWIKYNGLDGDTLIRMYYGNDGLSSGSSGVNTFIKFDDFPGTSFNAQWTVINTNLATGGIITGSANNNKILTPRPSETDYIVDIRMKPLSVGASTPDYQTGLIIATAADDIVYQPMVFQDSDLSRYWTAGSQYTMYTGLTTANYYVWSTTIRGTDSKIDYEILSDNRTSLATASDKAYSSVGDPGDRIGIQAMSGTGTTWVALGFFLIRKYTDVTPTYTIGAPQHQRRIPQFQ